MAIYVRGMKSFGSAGVRATVIAALAANQRSSQSMAKITKKSEEQKDAEAEVEGFRKNLGPFVVAAESTRMAMVFELGVQLSGRN